VNFYQLLDVPPDATPEQIKAAYRIQVQLYHPDRLQGAGDKVRAYAEERLKKINAAYTILSDPAKRRDYDARERAAQTARAYDDGNDSAPDFGFRARPRRNRSERQAARDWERQESEIRKTEEFIRRQREAAAQAERERAEAEARARQTARERYPRAHLQGERLIVTLQPELWMPFLRIPAGEFRMGSDPLQDPLAVAAERPQHLVRLSEYFIAQAPVTYEQYQAFQHAVRPGVAWGFPSNFDLHPVTNVSWDDALEFCNWLTGPGWKFRLPTEAEWEKAARGVDGRVFPWGNEWDATRTNADDFANTTTPVGLFSPAGDSPFGLSDMSGNVWEWCADKYNAEEYARREAIVNPTGPQAGEGVVIRGGAFDAPLKRVRCAQRNWDYPFKRRPNLGFRVVAVPVES